MQRYFFQRKKLVKTLDCLFVYQIAGIIVTLVGVCCRSGGVAGVWLKIAYL